jgi:hypothetical protein
VVVVGALVVVGAAVVAGALVGAAVVVDAGALVVAAGAALAAGAVVAAALAVAVAAVDGVEAEPAGFAVCAKAVGRASAAKAASDKAKIERFIFPRLSASEAELTSSPTATYQTART